MEHNEAMVNHTAERYLLHELSEQERDAYEEHFFTCSACAEEVKAATEFMDNARKVVQNELQVQIYSHAARRSIWGSWLNFRSMLHPIPAAACVFLVAVSAFAGYQNGVLIPRLSQAASAHVIPQVMVTVPLTLAHGGAGEGPVSKPLLFRFTIPKPDDPATIYDSYQAEIVSESNTKKYSFDLSKHQPDNPVEIFLAAGALRPGKYFMVISGVNSAGTKKGVKGELARIPFDIKFED